ncbi:MAG: aminodeoxychorismate lyase, partial [Adlercreutzia sp.]|nr:aminodeoxychorismate lyase [Adlercreutzia sp.]
MALHGKKVTYSSHSSRAARAAHAKGDREFRTYDTSAIMPKRSPVPFICLGVVAVVVIAAVCFFAFRGCVGSQVELLAPGQSAEVTITEGETASSIGDALVAARLIGSSREFTDEVTRLEASSALIPGTYTFQG